MSSIPPALLRFVEHDRGIWFMDLPVYERLVVQSLDVELPIGRVDGVHTGTNGVRVGYRFQVPAHLTRMQPNYLLVAKDASGTWEPYLGLPGLQFYVGNTGLLIVSTRITPFFRVLG